MAETVTIEKLVHGGQGLARIGNKPFFISFVLPGETVAIEITRHRRDHNEAKPLEIVTASPHRVEPPCRYFGSCGGCQWQHIEYAAQLHWKQEVLRETLQRIGKIEKP